MQVLNNFSKFEIYYYFLYVFRITINVIEKVFFDITCAAWAVKSSWFSTVLVPLETTLRITPSPIAKYIHSSILLACDSSH